MTDMKLSAFVRIGCILYGILQLSGLIDVLLEPEDTLKYVYGGILDGSCCKFCIYRFKNYHVFIVDIKRYVDLPMLQVWYIVFVPLLSLFLIVGGILVSIYSIQIHIHFLQYFDCQ